MTTPARAGENTRQGNLLPGDDSEPPFGWVGRGRVAVDGGSLHGEVDATDAGKVDRKVEQVRAMGERRQGPREC